jgi:uncharacterized protein with HEPN domain
VKSGARIARYVAVMRLDKFAHDEKTYGAVVRNLEVIGEAAKNVPADVRARAPDVEWRKIAGLRDVVAHGYFGLELETLWDLAVNKVPLLAERIGRLLEALRTGDGSPA